MSAATATPALDVDARIPLRGHLRHTGALVRRNLLWIRQDPESMFDRHQDGVEHRLRVLADPQQVAADEGADVARVRAGRDAGVALRGEGGFDNGGTHAETSS